MTRSGPRKKVDATYLAGRLTQARAYLEAARQAVILAEPGQSANPIISQIVLATIAYGDCLTAKRARVINQQDHAAAPKLLREVLREALPAEQERRYRRILAEKDGAQYGARAAKLSHAQHLLADLDEFARWAEEQL
jgi:hypothetical protein